MLMLMSMLCVDVVDVVVVFVTEKNLTCDSTRGCPLYCIVEK